MIDCASMLRLSCNMLAAVARPGRARERRRALPRCRAHGVQLCLVFSVAAAKPVHALDKQGSAHGGVIGGESSGTNVSGSVMFGSALYNPTYAARPDNTGHALFRYAARADIDLIGQRLSVPIDVNVFTDRDQPGFALMRPSEFDVIAGLTSTWPVGPGAVEIGSRVEHDRPVDRGTFTQTYVDVRARYLYSLARIWPELAAHDADVTGWATLGAFAVNPTYAARPDNSGKALLRYALHVELSILGDLLSFGLDGVMFTDRERSAFRPSELDITPEFIVHLPPFEVHLAYERDLPLDRAGLTQAYAYVLAAWNFDLRRQPGPLETRGEIRSP